MNFIEKFSKSIVGVLSGFDRMIFRGYLKSLCYAKGMMIHLCANDILLKNFKTFALKATDQVKAASLGIAEKKGRPIHYLNSSNVRKDDFAKKIMKDDKIESGLICTLKVIEPCYSFDIRKDRK